MREERVGGEDNEEGERGKSSNKPMYVPSMYVRTYVHVYSTHPFSNSGTHSR